VPDADLVTAPDASQLRRASVRGAIATFSAQVVQFVVSLTTTAVLARLLTPADFGLVAMVAAVAGVVTLVGDLGLSQATVQREDITAAQVTALFWVNAGVGVAVALAMVPTAFGVAAVYKEPKLVALAMAYGLLFLPAALSVQHRALLQRRMDFRSIAWIGVASNLGGAAAAILAARAGLGYWALVILPGTTGVLTMVGMWWRARWIPSGPRRTPHMAELLSFGGYVSGFNLLNYVGRNGDNVLIGARWGAKELGFYSKAYSLLLLPLQQINHPVSAVALPALARVQGQPDRFRRAYLRYMSALSSVTLPGIAFMIVFAPEICLAVLGPQWVAAAGIFRLLGVASLLQAVTNPLGTLMLSLGRARRMFGWALINNPLTVLAFWLGLAHGARGVALAYAIYTVGITLPLLVYACRGSPVTVLDILGSVTPGASVAAIVCLVSMGIRAWAGGGLSALATVIMGCAAAAVVWLLSYTTAFSAHNPLSLLRELRMEPRAS